MTLFSLTALNTDETIKIKITLIETRETNKYHLIFYKKGGNLFNYFYVGTGHVLSVPNIKSYFSQNTDETDKYQLISE